MKVFKSLLKLIIIAAICLFAVLNIDFLAEAIVVLSLLIVSAGFVSIGLGR